uniref:(northern house mosquito) hypothetical protein n=1 Tax=Culex pipiens TaxID=7175 RepID=A0A8D8C7G6_CULPI
MLENLRRAICCSLVSVPLRFFFFDRPSSLLSTSSVSVEGSTFVGFIFFPVTLTVLCAVFPFGLPLFLTSDTTSTSLASEIISSFKIISFVKAHSSSKSLSSPVGSGSTVMLISVEKQSKKSFRVR